MIIEDTIKEIDDLVILAVKRLYDKNQTKLTACQRENLWYELCELRKREGIYAAREFAVTGELKERS